MRAEHLGGASPLVVETPLQVNHTGTYLVARVGCKAIHAQPGFLVLDPPRDRLVLTAECGCHVYVPLSPWLADLAKLLREQPQGGHCPVPADAGPADPPEAGAPAPAALH